MKRKSVTSYKHMFLYRTGLKIEPDDSFVEKFIEIYMSLLRNKKHHKNDETIDINTAKFFINSVVESIIYCLDFGLDVWLSRTLLFLNKTSDYRLNSTTAKHRILEDVHKITIKPIVSMINKIKHKVNETNEKYKEFLQSKKESFTKIKEYYREFYGKQEDWWQ